ncbi:hypothetical protein NFJ68_16885 [Klebsiella aerogenes]|uniref:hypothetical protein n=1 Tax=Klebsiella aerogenes TaxID=548 RepID=UPI002433F227|nr:hypothetical protein [Klebsiella aerogenes]WFW25386.1 hypothetical protein NFJ68_16885 [Klebsiella aerogenes]
MSLPISNKALRELHKDTEYMLGLRGPAIDKEWWERVHSVVVELQERRKADSEPVMSFYRDGIEAAAKWLDQQREAYDSEHGWSDPDTGMFEFGNDAQRDYSSTLEELAEGIRALHPNAGNSPVIPDGYVLVPKEPTEEMNKAGWAAMNEHDAINPTYRAMLAAAPQEVSHD